MEGKSDVIYYLEKDEEESCEKGDPRLWFKPVILALFLTAPPFALKCSDLDDKFYVHHGFQPRGLGEWNINGRDRYLREGDFCVVRECYDDLVC